MRQTDKFSGNLVEASLPESRKDSKHTEGLKDDDKAIRKEDSKLSDRSDAAHQQSILQEQRVQPQQRLDPQDYRRCKA